MAELLGALLLLKARRETRHGRRREQQVNRKGTLEQIIVIDASFPPSLYIYLSISLSLSPCERHTCSNLPGFKILFAVVPLTLAIPKLTLSLSLSLSLPARDIPVATFLASKFYLQWYL